MLVVIQMTVQQAVLMVNMTVVLMVVHMVSASMAAGHVMAWMIAMTAQMKPTVVVLHVPMVNLTVVPIVVHMVSASMAHGHVTAWLIVMTAQMKLTVLLHHVKTRVYGIVAMASVFQHHMYVMAQVNFVTQAGVLTVPMAQMKA